MFGPLIQQRAVFEIAKVVQGVADSDLQKNDENHGLMNCFVFQHPQIVTTTAWHMLGRQSSFLVIQS